MTCPDEFLIVAVSPTVSPTVPGPEKVTLQSFGASPRKCPLNSGRLVPVMLVRTGTLSGRPAKSMEYDPSAEIIRVLRTVSMVATTPSRAVSFAAMSVRDSVAVSMETFSVRRIPVASSVTVTYRSPLLIGNSGTLLFSGTVRSRTPRVPNSTEYGP